MDQELPNEQFPSTLWTLVTNARLQSDEGRQALARVIERYIPALRAYIRRAHGMVEEDADDVLQSFILEKFLENELTAKADKELGRFRALLMASLDRFVISQARKRQAARRDERTTKHLSDPSALPDAILTAGRDMEVEWVRETVAEAVQRMRTACEQNNRLDVWGVFEGRLLAEMMETPPTPYEVLAARYSLASPAAASNLLITAKRMFVRILRSVVAEYEPSAMLVDAELAALRETIARSRFSGISEAGE